MNKLEQLLEKTKRKVELIGFVLSHDIKSKDFDPEVTKEIIATFPELAELCGLKKEKASQPLNILQMILVTTRL